MATGYTAGIEARSIQTFEQFAIRCMRAMGATIHMRDDSLDVPYYKSKPESYHIDCINKLRGELNDLNLKTDQMLIKDISDSLEMDMQRNEEKVIEKIELRKKLNSFIEKAKKYKPPTKEHEGIRKFMLQQLISTRESDCDPHFYIQENERISISLQEIDPVIIREEEKNRLLGEIDYHQTKFDRDKNVSEERNKWVNDFIESLK